MTDSAQTTGAPESQPVTASWTPPTDQPSSGPAAEHPELVVGAAFAGGLVTALILKRLAG